MVESVHVCGPSSEVTGKEREHRVVMEAWNWARYTANNFIGGFSVSVREIIESEELDSRWYKLLDKKSTQVRYQKVVANVQHGGFQRGSEMVPESRGLPKMTLQDFNLLAVLGKGNTGKVPFCNLIGCLGIVLQSDWPSW